MSAIIVPLQGFAVDGERWINEARLEEIAQATGLPLKSYKGNRRNWPAALRGERRLWRSVARVFAEWLDGRECFFLGHSDGASMAVRLTITLRSQVRGVCCYAGMHRAFSRHENLSSETWPPALFMVNSHDQTPAGGNVQLIHRDWNGPKLLQVHDNPNWTSILESHEWKPQFANPLCVQFISEIQAVLAGRSLT